MGRETYFLTIFYDNKTWNLCQRFCQKDPGGSQRGGLGWGSWAVLRVTWLGVRGEVWSFCPCRALGKRGFGARVCNSTPHKSSCCPVSIPLCPSSQQEHLGVTKAWNSKVWLTRGIGQLTATQIIA